VGYFVVVSQAVEAMAVCPLFEERSPFRRGQLAWCLPDPLPHRLRKAMLLRGAARVAWWVRHVLPPRLAVNFLPA
jgi:hypothetical protein